MRISPQVSLDQWLIPTLLPGGPQLFDVAVSTYFVGMFAVKASLLLLYKRTFTGYFQWFRVLWWFAMGLSVLYTLPFTILASVNCVPLKAAWDFALLMSPLSKCIDAPLMFIVHGALNSFTDILILAIPLPIIFGLQMSTRRKIMVSLIMAVGSAACVISIYRCARLAIGHASSGLHYDFTWDSMTATILS